jgi:peptide/nickel transport system substrate-binding protein
VDRRVFLKTTGAAVAATTAGGLACPALSQGATARTLRLVPHADLANFDPIWSPAYIARNAALLVWDTLYGIDTDLQPQRQMIEAEEVSADGLLWTFRLRPGLKFHDGEPVLATDAVASIRRWAAREPMGQMIKAVESEIAVVDDRTFRWSLRRPFPKMLLALGKMATPCCFIMPARIAATDPSKQISERVGSGPMRFVKNEWLPGARAVFEKFADYSPRQESASWLAGGKADTRRASGMGGDLRPGHSRSSAAKRRSRLVGAAAARLDSDLAEEPQRRSRHSRSARVDRHVVHEPPVPAIQ